MAFARVSHGFYDAGGEAQEAHMPASASDILSVEIVGNSFSWGLLVNRTMRFGPYSTVTRHGSCGVVYPLYTGIRWGGENSEGDAATADKAIQRLNGLGQATWGGGEQQA